MPLEPPSGSRKISTLAPQDAFRVLREHGLRVQRPRFVNNPDVWGIEVGIREVGGSPILPREPCLKLYVYRKGAATSGFDVDPWTTANTPDLGRVAFRTDIEPLGSLRAQAPHWTRAPEVVAGNELGSGFAIIRADGIRYLVSAGHVLDSLTQHAATVLWRKDEAQGRGAWLNDDDLQWPLWFDDESQLFAFADLGLVQVAPGQLGPYEVEGLTPRSQGIVRWHEATDLDHVSICGKHGRVNARFSARVPPGLLISDGSNTVRYWRLLRFRQLDGPTREGDSGAPILAADGRLVGMHVARQRSTNPTRHYSLAMCAGDIVDHLAEELGSIEVET